MRFLLPALVAGLILPMFLAPGLAAPPGPPAPALLTTADVPTWRIGDAWTFTTHVSTRDGGNWTEVYTNVTFLVTERFDRTVGGVHRYLHNATTTGDIAITGNMTEPTTMAVVSLDLAGTVQGYVWTERGDLALVRTNETFLGSGQAYVLGAWRPTDADGSTSTVSDPPQEDFDFPVEVGDEWRLASTARTVGYAHVFVNMPFPLPDIDFTQPIDANVTTAATSWVNGSEFVTVPTGTFEALRVHSADAGGTTVDRWYAPNASNYVRLESHAASGPQQYSHTWTNLTSYALTNPAFATSTVLVPQRVGGGAPFEVVVETEAGAAVRVTIPATNLTASGIADPFGDLTITVPAPAFDDNTPASLDGGSHGVLVEADNGSAMSFAAATITLDPRNFVIAAITWTPATVIDGVPTSVTAFVTADSVFFGPVDVTFVAEDVDLNRDGVLDSSLSTFCGRSFCATSTATLAGTVGNTTVMWTPAPPSVPATVTMSAVADPTDAYRELSETDNLLHRTIAVQAPNLTLANATVTIGTSTSTFDDPGVFGFVSPIFPILVGTRAELSVRVRNAGEVNATRTTSLAFYNTTVLNGSGDPPFAQSTVPPLGPGAFSESANASWTAPSAAGTYYVNLTADQGGALRETSEADNTFVVRFRVENVTNLPDLVPVGVSGPTKASVGRAVNVSARVWNRGGGDASGFRVAFYNDSERATPFALFTVGPLAAGANSTVLQAPWSSPALGVHTIWIEVDYDDIVPETDGANNTASLTISVHDVPITTLSIGSPKVVSNTTYILPTTPLTFSAQDRAAEGPPTIWYRVDSGPWATIAQGAPLYLGGGAHTVSYNSTDLLGGVEPSQVGAVFVDDLPPETEAAVANGTTGKVVTLTATDLASGVNWTEYRIDNLTWVRYAGTSIEITEPGVHTVEFRSEDLLGNREPVRAIIVAVEGTGVAPPTALNVKPFLALAFVAILLVAGLLASPSAEPARRRRWFLTVVLPPTLVEGFTGVASLFVAEMAVPGGPLGLAVDLALLAIGLLVIWFSRHRALRAA